MNFQAKIKTQFKRKLLWFSWIVNMLCAWILNILVISLKVITVFHFVSFLIKGSCIQFTLPMWYHGINLNRVKIPIFQILPGLVSAFNTIFVITDFLDCIQCMTDCHAWKYHVVKIFASRLFNNITNWCWTVQKVLVCSFIYCCSCHPLPLFIINRLSREFIQRIRIHYWCPMSQIWNYTFMIGWKSSIRNWRSREVLLDLSHSDSASSTPPHCPSIAWLCLSSCTWSP